MSERIDGTFTTVTVKRSWTVGRPDGSTAMVLDTMEAEPIAFALDLRAIQNLQEHLADAALLLSQKPGQA
ncbi:MAG: hypothetical protein ABI439_00005 [Rhodospirillales bacterium]